MTIMQKGCFLIRTNKNLIPVVLFLLAFIVAAPLVPGNSGGDYPCKEECEEDDVRLAGGPCHGCVSGLPGSELAKVPNDLRNFAREDVDGERDVKKEDSDSDSGITKGNYGGEGFDTVDGSAFGKDEHVTDYRFTLRSRDDKKNYEFHKSWDDDGQPVYEIEFPDEGETTYRLKGDTDIWGRENFETDSIEVREGEDGEFQDADNIDVETFGKLQDIFDEGTGAVNEVDLDNLGLKINEEEYKERQELWGKYEEMGRGAVLDVLNSWTSQFLDRFAMEMYSTLCGTRLYVDDKREPVRGTFMDSLMAPEIQYGSELDDKMLGLAEPTVIIEGEKSQLTSRYYRYALNLKLIGSQRDEWVVYFYNSCTHDNSYDKAIETEGSLGWRRHEEIHVQQHVGYHFSGDADRELIFDCDEEPCRFNKACVIFEETAIPGASDENRMPDSIEGVDKDPYCVTLTHGSGFNTEGKTGSYDC